MKKLSLLTAGVLAAVLLSGCGRTVMLVTQYPEGSPRSMDAAKGIADAFSFENISVNLEVYDMNATARTSELWRTGTGNNAVAHMAAYHPEVIFVAGDEAAKIFAQRFVDDHSKKIIYLDIAGNPADYGLAHTWSVTGVSPQTPVLEAVQLLQAVAPNAKRIAVLSDMSPAGTAIIRDIRAAQGKIPATVTDVRQVRTFPEWVAALSDFQTRADAICIAAYSELQRDQTDPATVPPAEVLNQTSKINHLPDFSFYKEAVGQNGVLAAATVPMEAQGKLAGKLAVQYMFYDQSIGKLPPVKATAVENLISPTRAGELRLTVPMNVKYTAVKN